MCLTGRIKFSWVCGVGNKILHFFELSQKRCQLCDMGNRHTTTIWIFLGLGAFFVILPLFYVIVMGVGSAIGIWNESQQREKPGMFPLTSSYFLQEEVTGYTLYLQMPLFPDKPVWTEGIDSLWVREEGLALANQSRYFLALPQGSYQYFENAQDFYAAATKAYPDFSFGPAAQVLDSLQSIRLRESR